MGKTYIDTLKYVVYADLEIRGLVEKPDVVGAIFGQTEGLLGDELDLRDLQKNGRIGRIEVELNAKSGKTTGNIKLPSSLDMVETCILAAALETVDRVGPCEAFIKVEKVEDTRNLKRKTIIDRAKNLLRNLLNTEIPESKVISDTVRNEVKTAEIIEYGKDRLAAGPNIDKFDSIILVEGRADVLNLLRSDIPNVVAVGGAKINDTIIKLGREKELTVFLDGDRGGDIILTQLKEVLEIDFVARAPTGKEVEELTRKEIIKALRNKLPVEQVDAHKPNDTKMNYERTEEEIKKPMRSSTSSQSRSSKITTTPVKKFEKPDYSDKPPKELEDSLKHLENTLKAKFYDKTYAQIKELPVRDVIKTLENEKEVEAVVFDGIVTQRLVDLAESQGVKYLIGIKAGNIFKKPENLVIITKD
ncbi:DNA primase [Candidatus Micrarchaeota archaeon]|nr:DNA primase [Candidatus Micrarchaeota archaeon]